ncbi:hypothetical protein RHGRI_005050 [Rhododendron griersonianum]|uniref:Uncharacterized protein n=1 Tax=Rhododendron griersonianum TaxID=479676 RepID=A0AAV6LB32_9ERIC|nr:hypothetical protein RHGRI_005050 [Rhododendron griersonianum]
MQRTCKFEVGQSSTSAKLMTRETSPCPLIPTGERMSRGRGVPRRRGVQRSIVRGLETTQKGVARGTPTTAGTTQRVVTGGLSNAQRGVTRGVASGRGQRGTIGAPRTMGTGATRGRGVARGRGLVGATIGGASAMGTGGARTTRSATFGGAGAVQTSGARTDRDGATRIGGTTGGAKTVEVGSMIRHGKKNYLKSAVSEQSQQGWKIARIGDGVFSSQATKGSTKGSTQ